MAVLTRTVCQGCGHDHDGPCDWNVDHVVGRASLLCISEGGDFPAPRPFDGPVVCRHRCSCPRRFTSSVTYCAGCVDPPAGAEDVAVREVPCAAHEPTYDDE